MKIIAEKRQPFVETIVRQFGPSTRDNENTIDFDYFGLHFNKLANALLWINQYGILYLNLVFHSTQSCIKPLSNKSDGLHSALIKITFFRDFILNMFQCTMNVMNAKVVIVLTAY